METQELYSQLMQKADNYLAKGYTAEAIQIYERIPSPEARAKIEEAKSKPQKKPEEKEEEDEDKEDNVYKFDTKFSDIIGLEKCKKILHENITLAIKHPELYDLYGKERNFSLIMYGAPGTGKTTLAKALSGELDINIVLARIDEIIDAYTGETEKNIKKLFDEAKANKPCILFLDEFDTLGGSKSGLGKEGTAQIMRNAINVLKQEMDGIQASKEDMFIIAATNEPWNIEPELKRSGRFGISLYIPLPKYRERKALFKYYMKDKKHGRLSYGRLARATPVYSPSDIKNICDKAASKAISRHLKTEREQEITMGDIFSILRNRDMGKSTVMPWLNNFINEQLGHSTLTKIGKQKVASVHEGKIPKTEREQYKDLIKEAKDIREHKATDEILRFVALYLM
jgi:SpoVK/Ycf46/Vps4 family AAA+-type ATPase